MVSKSTLRNILPPFQGHYIVRVDDQDTKDIVKWILRVHPKYAPDYDLIYPYFDTGNTLDTCATIWKFLKTNFTYNAETLKDQSIKSPAAILEPGEKIDCKHYSLFAGGVLDAIKRNTGDNFTWCYRFASYNGDITPGHVFVVVKENGREIWIDPVLEHFDERKQPSYYFDKKPNMALLEISGIGSKVRGKGIGSTSVNKWVDVDKNIAVRDMMVLTNINWAGLKDLFLKNPAITNGPVKQYFISMGFPFNTFMDILKSSDVKI